MSLKSLSGSLRRKARKSLINQAINDEATWRIQSQKIQLPGQRGERTYTHLDNPLPGYVARKDLPNPTWNDRVNKAASGMRSSVLRDTGLYTEGPQKATAAQKRGLRRMMQTLSPSDKRQLIDLNKQRRAFSRRLSLTGGTNAFKPFAHDASHVLPTGVKHPNLPKRAVYGVDRDSENRVAVIEKTMDRLWSKRPTSSRDVEQAALTRGFAPGDTAYYDKLLNEAKAYSGNKAVRAQDFLIRLGGRRQGYELDGKYDFLRRGVLFSSYPTADFAYQPMTKRRWLRVLKRWQQNSRKYDLDDEIREYRTGLLDDIASDVRQGASSSKVDFLVKRDGKRRRAVGIVSSYPYANGSGTHISELVGNPKPGFKGAVPALRQHLASAKLPDTHSVSIIPINYRVQQMYERELKARRNPSLPGQHTYLGELRKNFSYKPYLATFAFEPPRSERNWGWAADVGVGVAPKKPQGLGVIGDELKRMSRPFTGAARSAFKGNWEQAGRKLRNHFTVPSTPLSGGLVQQRRVRWGRVAKTGALGVGALGLTGMAVSGINKMFRREDDD